MTTPTPFQERLAQHRAREAAEQAAKAPTPPPSEDHTYDEDIPVLDQDSGISQERLELDQVLAQVGIIDGYVRWCGKMTPNMNTRKTEGIMISCPRPDHADSKPSAWANTDKNTWFCGGCQEGGDVFDIASYKYGINYRNDPSSFVDLKKQMAGDLGYRVERSLTGENYVEKVATWVEETEDAVVVPDERSVVESTTTTSSPTPSAPPLSLVAPIPSPSSSPEPVVAVSEPVPSSNVIQLDAELESLFLQPRYPELDWRAIVTPETFLHTWMTEMSKDTLPEEYYFMMGLMGIGAAVGRAGSIEENSVVYPNLLCCLIGGTGIGKSRSSARLSQLLNKALPYDNDNFATLGIKNVPLPGSGEVLQKHFSREIIDPNNPKVIMGYAPVKGLVDFDEFSNLTTRSSRAGSTLQQTLMRLFDGYLDTTAMGSLTHGIAVVEKPFTMGLATTQPNNIQQLVSKFDKSSGFLNRWFFVTGNAKEPSPFDTDKVDIDPSVAALKRIHTWVITGNGKTFNFDQSAIEAYTKFFRSRIRDIKMNEDVTGGLLSRLELAAKKIMLILAANERTNIITSDHVAKMIPVYNYLEKTYLFLNGLVGNHEDVPVQEALIATLTRHQGKFKRPIKKRELFKGRLMQEFGAEKIVRVMRSMGELGFLEEVEVVPAKGNRWKGYKLTDAATGTGD